MKTCAWCRVTLEATLRSDAKFCSKRCRQASHRFGSAFVARRRATLPMKLTYADPPYPGKAGYYRDHPDFAGEVDHSELLSRLQERHRAAEIDGWALSTSSRSLAAVLACCRGGTRVAAWFRGSRPVRSAHPLQAWEPVVYAGGRRVVSSKAGDDALVYPSRPRLTDPDRVIGAKPAAFWQWLFDLFGARPGDEFEDLFPGSGGGSRAWARFEELAVGPRDPTRLDQESATRRAELEQTRRTVQVVTRRTAPAGDASD